MHAVLVHHENTPPTTGLACVLQRFWCFLWSCVLGDSFQNAVKEWDDVVVVRQRRPATLICTHTPVEDAITINWKAKSIGAEEWQLVLSASKGKKFSGSASKTSMRLTDPNFIDTGVFSLSFLPKMEDGGLYSCLVMQKEQMLKEKIFLLAILTVTIVPATPLPRLSTLRLIGSVNPDVAIDKIIWVAPGGISIMRSEAKPNTGTVAKLPRVQKSDNGAYVCIVHPWDSNNTIFPFNVDVTVDVNSAASFTNLKHGPIISTAIQAQTSFTLICPGVQGDYVQLYWHPPDSRKQRNMTLMYQYDRWRSSTWVDNKNKRFQLAGPPYNAESGSFSFLMTPLLKEAGVYYCDVFLNDNVFRQRTLLSVFKVKMNIDSSKLELKCLYSERSQIRSVKWTYQDKNRQLQLLSNGPGSIVAVVQRPITSETAGNYTCTIQLKNGQTVWATEAVKEPIKESVSVTTPSLLPSLSALLLLVPLVAATVCVLLWRQKHISDRGIEQSLSVRSCEAENIYENPEDVRQALPQTSLYMDLKPRGVEDVYKELETFEQCQS